MTNPPIPIDCDTVTHVIARMQEVGYREDNPRLQIELKPVIPFAGTFFGLNNDQLNADGDLICDYHNWARFNLVPRDEEVLAEVCLRYVIELRSHLAMRRMKREIGTPQEKQVVFFPFGGGHILSIVGELRKKDYADFSFLIVLPNSYLSF